MNVKLTQETVRRPPTVTWAFTLTLTALGIFAILTTAQIIQTLSPESVSVLEQDILRSKTENAVIGAEEVERFIPLYRLGLLGWLAVLGSLYLVIAFSFRRGSRTARAAAAVLALVSVVGLFLPGSLTSLWVLLNSASAALLFTRPSRIFFSRPTLPSETTRD